MNNLFLIMSLNMVLISENGMKVERPAQMIYYEDSTLRISLLDTAEVYNVEKASKHKGSLILRIESEGCKGFITINKQTSGREVTGTVWFYRYCNHKLVERKFILDRKRCFRLVKKYRNKKS